MTEAPWLTARRLSALTAAAVLGGFGVLVVPAAANAATFEASTTAELIAAINDANATPGLDTIRLAAGDYPLTGDLPAFTDDVEVIGDGPTTTIIDAAGWLTFGNDQTAGTLTLRFEGFAVNDALAAAISVEKSNATVRDVALTGTGINIVLPDDGGTAIVEDVTVAQSTGHGIYIRGGFSDIQVRRATVQDSVGAGLYVAVEDSTVTVDAVTATGNALEGVSVAAWLSSQATLTDLVVSGNGTDGLGLVVEESAAEVRGVEAHDNAADGVDVTARTSLVEISAARVSGSGDDGIEAHAVSTDARITMTGAVSTGNTNSGIVVGSAGQSGRIDIADSTFTGNGSATGSDDACGVAVVDDTGTGVRATLVRSTVADNPAVLGGVCLLFDGATGGSLEITDTTVSGNTVFMAAVYANLPQGTTLDILNSTISDNGSLAGGFLGGGLLAGGLIASGEVTVRSTTIANNSAGNFNVLFAELAQATVSDSILSGHPSGDLFLESMSTLQIDTTLVQTVDDTASATVAAGAGNLTDVDPLLLPLAANGGPTLTRLPAEGSPVIDAGDPAYAGPSTDQRGTGFARPVGSRVDLGAVEFIPTGTVPAAPTLPETGVDTGTALGLAATGLLLGLLGLGFTLAARRRIDG